MTTQSIIQHLSQTIGERHLGSTGEQQAQDYIAEVFTHLGYEVAREPFSTPGWKYGRFQVTLSPGGSVEAFPCFFSPGGKVTAPLKAYDSDTPLHEYQGVVAFSGNHDFVEVGDTNKIAEDLDKAGALGFILNSPYNDTYSTKIIRSPHINRMLVFTVSRRTAMRLAREEGKEITLELEAERFEHQSYNIVGRHRTPPESSKGKLVIGGHYDTAPGIPGAADNASGIAALLKIAERFKDSHSGWDIDFVAFGGEEYGGPGYGIGGYDYYQKHAKEPIVAMLCLDDLGSYLTRPQAWIGRSSGLRSLVRKHSERSKMKLYPFRRGSDQGIFDKHGIPTIWFKDEGNPTGVMHFPLHSPQDCEEVINYVKLENLILDIGDLVENILLHGIPEPTPPEITQGTDRDTEAIIRLVQEVWTMGLGYLREQSYGRLIGGRSWKEWTADSVREYITHPQVKVLKIENAGELAGFISYKVDPQKRLGEIGYNAVNPQFRGEGLGKHLLQAALKQLRGEEIDNIEVVTGLDDGHAPARAVYESAGFEAFRGSILYTMKV